jgi:ATP-dependent helicase HrpA
LTSWGKKGIDDWNFEDLPERLRVKDKHGLAWELFPALEARADGVDLRLFAHKDQAEASHIKGVRALFMKHFSQDLKFLKKNLTLHPTMKTEAQYFGGLNPIENMIFQSVLDELFLKNIRTRNEYVNALNTLKQEGIHLQGQNKREIVTQLLTVHHEARNEFYQLETSNRRNELILLFLAERRRDLSKLLPEQFISLYDTNKLFDILRYIKALSIRTRRGVVNLEKDRQREKEVLAMTDVLDRLIETLSPDVSPDKRVALEEFYWLLEEYKISVFAQEVKTAVRVSRKMLLEKSKEIQRMI